MVGNNRNNPNNGNQEKGILFLDGGLGTSLEDKYGVKFSESTPLWSSHLVLTDPETLLSCQRDFAQVPVDILQTATYQISVKALASTITQYPDGEVDVYSFLRKAVDIAKTAALPSTKIALSLGPYGASMIPSTEYTGRYDPEHGSVDALEQWHLDRLGLFRFAGVFDRPGVSYIAFETIPRLDEISAVRKAHSQIGLPAAEVPFWISCVYPGDGDTLPDGADVKDVVRAMLQTQPGQTTRPWGIGINCTKIWKLPALVQKYEDAIKTMMGTGELKEEDWPALVLYPDGTNGEVYNPTSKTWERPAGVSGPEIPWETQLSEIVLRAKARRVWRQIVVGGCCKASHEDIRRLREAVESQLG
ncbi:homocysteine S-methyltransferase [Diplogelasinospora grovesii]|uniref:Homocysteine S-methyltransferase n=1 Tax=Diplogelasinospora grovesii TaxID=303347 RepID=A0AAN6MXS1_9PEZI|nr:homocysteine S-methyltransferase [Diplogelasinospora grovesii]